MGRCALSEHANLRSCEFASMRCSEQASGNHANMRVCVMRLAFGVKRNGEHASMRNGELAKMVETTFGNGMGRQGNFFRDRNDLV